MHAVNNLGLRRLPVVSADPKSKTGEEDRKELIKLYEFRDHDWRIKSFVLGSTQMGEVVSKL